MAGETASLQEAAMPSRNNARHNDRSTIAFPYLDLEAAVATARAVYAAAGHGDCEIDELATQMQQTVSGAFRLKTSTAKLFGLVEKGDRGSFRLSETGQRIVVSETEPYSRVVAFLNVPLYRAIYDRYRGHLLPPSKALEREMEKLGVAPKQTNKARQTFERSARQAGFFVQGEDRLVQPISNKEAPSTVPAINKEMPKTKESTEPRFGGGNGGGNLPPRQPLEYQLIDLLKHPGIGEEERNAIWTLVQYLANLAPQEKAASES